jgi:hypothetical protein
MISRILSDLCNVHHQTTPKQIAYVCGVHPNTVYNWLRGSTPPGDAIQRLIVHHPNPAVQERLVEWMSGGRATIGVDDAVDLDINADGKVDTEDVLDGAIEAVDDAAAVLRRVRESYRNGRRAGETETAHINEAIGALRHTIERVALITFELNQRKPAKQPAEGATP